MYETYVENRIMVQVRHVNESERPSKVYVSFAVTQMGSNETVRIGKTSEKIDDKCIGGSEAATLLRLRICS